MCCQNVALKFTNQSKHIRVLSCRYSRVWDFWRSLLIFVREVWLTFTFNFNFNKTICHISVPKASKFLSVVKTTDLFGAISLLYATIVPVGKFSIMKNSWFRMKNSCLNWISFKLLHRRRHSTTHNIYSGCNIQFNLNHCQFRFQYVSGKLKFLHINIFHFYQF